MQLAIAFLAVSSVGVMFGWQPMPDGCPQYEYVVQIEPELLATMKEGTTIPISSEVPDDIRPIARIRIMVGSETLPRERLAGDIKPWPERESRERLLETQYVAPAAGLPQDPRYQNQQILPPASNSGQILPPTSRPQSTADGFGQSLQRSAEQARNTASQGDILPPTSEIRPAQSPPSYSQPIETANQQSGNQSDISRLFGGGPAANQGQIQPIDQRTTTGNDRYPPPTIGDSQILPPARTTPSTADDWRANETPTAGNRYQRLDEPITAPPARDLRQAAGAAAPAANTPGVFNAPWPPLERFADAPLAQEWNSRTAPDSRGTAQPIPSNTNPADLPDSGTSSNSRAFDVAERTTTSGARPGNDALSFPASQSNNSSTNRAPSSSDHPQSPPPTPEIRREDLLKPADAELVNSSGEPVRSTPASFPVTTGQPTSTTQPLFPQPGAVATQPAGPTGPAPQASGGTGNNSKAFPLLLAWVLLSGSGAGNLYLFWSYLDIRHKYRGLIRTAGRKLRRGRVREEVEDEDDED